MQTLPSNDLNLRCVKYTRQRRETRCPKAPGLKILTPEQQQRYLEFPDDLTIIHAANSPPRINVDAVGNKANTAITKQKVSTARVCT